MGCTQVNMYFFKTKSQFISQINMIFFLIQVGVGIYTSNMEVINKSLCQSSYVSQINMDKYEIKQTLKIQYNLIKFKDSTYKTFFSLKKKTYKTFFKRIRSQFQQITDVVLILVYL